MDNQLDTVASWWYFFCGIGDSNQLRTVRSWLRRFACKPKCFREINLANCQADGVLWILLYEYWRIFSGCLTSGRATGEIPQMKEKKKIFGNQGLRGVNCGLTEVENGWTGANGLHLKAEVVLYQLATVDSWRRSFWGSGVNRWHLKMLVFTQFRQ